MLLLVQPKELKNGKMGSSHLCQHYICFRMTKIKRMIPSNAGEDEEKLDHSHSADRNVK